MVGYIQKMLAEIPGGMDGEAATLAANHLFEVNQSADKLEEETAQLFHHNLAKLPFLQTSTTGCASRGCIPDHPSPTAGRRRLQKTTQSHAISSRHCRLALTLEADNAHIVKWWVDASFTVHQDMKSHTGGMLSLKGQENATHGPNRHW
jgi:hypothetical protein